MAIVSGLPTQQSPSSSIRHSYDFRALSRVPDFSSRPLDLSCRVGGAEPTYVRGVTRMQSETAHEMTGGRLDGSGVEVTGDLTGSAADGMGQAAGRGATAGRAAEMPGRTMAGIRGWGRFLGPVSTVLELAGGAIKINNAWNDRSLNDEQRDTRVGQAVVGTGAAVAGGVAGATAGAIGGAKLGALIGTFCCPLVGTFVGGVVGGALGAALGGFLGGKGGEKLGEWASNNPAGRAAGNWVNNTFGPAHARS